ncbi:MAG: LptF/LptG family permease [Kiritimatiellia bacterium]
MKILTRYVLREFCVPLFYCLVGFLSIYLLFELFGSFSRLMEAKPGALKACTYFAGYLAPYFKWMAPACLMLATLYTMWNFCRHSEVIAMRASGIGFLTIVKPLLVVSVLMALFVGWVNEVYVPRHGQWAKQYRASRFNEEEMEKADDIVFHNAAQSRTWRIGLLVNDNASILEDVAVSVNYPGGGRKMTIKSPRAECLDGVWYLMHPEIAYYTELGEEMPSPTPDLDKLSLRPFIEFNERPSDFLLQNRDLAFCSVQERLHHLKMHPALTQEARSGLLYDTVAQMVAPLACIIITLFAIPAGIATGRQSVFRGIVTALCMFFAFYALTIGCMICAKKGWLPPIPAAILPDVVFLVVGCRLFWRQR